MACSSDGVWASHWGGFSCCRAGTPGHAAFSSHGMWVLQLQLPGSSVQAKSCGTQSYLLRGTWGLPGSGTELMSPALSGRFFTTEPPGKHCLLTSWWVVSFFPVHLYWFLLVTIYFIQILSINHCSNQIRYYEMMDIWPGRIAPTT